MKVRKCDRCGKIIEPEVKKARSISEMLGDITKTITDAVCVLTGVTIYSVYADKEPADLCKECMKSFNNWMKYGQAIKEIKETIPPDEIVRNGKTYKLKTEEEKPAVEEINIRTNAAGIAEENIPKFGD